MPDLDDQIQALPQELQDIILDFVVATPRVVDIDVRYRPPVGLHICKAIRAKTAKSFYGKQQAFAIGVDTDDYSRLLGKWLGSLPAEHGVMIEEIRFSWPHWPVYSCDDNCRPRGGHATVFDAYLMFAKLSLARMAFLQQAHKLEWKFHSCEVVHLQIEHVDGQGLRHLQWRSLATLAAR